ncbi:hypothetical protein HOU03_gp212 [Caulobacter phage CcrSC]|uniref:Ribosome modulation factor n=1 Tax=Caulobacter phage CcrSC TaxID=2283272 RepID=A0A385EEH0_9CAUD|nr:hypothetical protein HOU03_gp212 [Caulobacter phage CcrSC]AXQ70056.1 hypothetical protein CcrSC_gp474 [Caulobacter phage CcrSC]
MITAQEERDAREEGWQAAKAGKRKSSNPHFGTRGRAWAQGWIAGKDDSETPQRPDLDEA